MLNVLQKDEVTKMEILWCLFTVDHEISNRTSASAVDLFKFMFNGDNTAQLFQLGRDKIAYTVVYGIARFVKQKLRHELSQSPFFVVQFDESLNKVSQRGQMDLNVRFWSDNTVVSRYFGSQFLGHATALDLSKALTEGLDGTDQAKLIQIGMDGPNVNHVNHFKIVERVACF